MGLLDLLKGGGGGAGITSIDVDTAHQRVKKKALTLIDRRMALWRCSKRAHDLLERPEPRQ